MKNNYLIKAISFFLFLVLIVPFFNINVLADTGPKPSVQIDVLGLNNRKCFATLLSKYESNGPNRAWDGKDEHINSYSIDREIWEAFVNYKDSDGYYFLQVGFDISETEKISWRYYPPNPFKILLYFPETDTYLSSGIYERYAFDSYYTVSITDMTETNVSVIIVEKSYDYFSEIIGLLFRVVITVIIEIIIALAFGFRKKNQLLFLLKVNVLTQIVLNFLLNYINYKSGSFYFLLNYVLFEIIVFVIEAVLYSSHLRKINEVEQIIEGSFKTKKRFYVIYALVANVVSFGFGIFISKIIPEMF